MHDKRTYNGAWLTDIDDTLLPSGEKPNDEMTPFITRFITILPAYL